MTRAARAPGATSIDRSIGRRGRPLFKRSDGPLACAGHFSSGPLRPATKQRRRPAVNAIYALVTGPYVIVIRRRVHQDDRGRFFGAGHCRLCLLIVRAPVRCLPPACAVPCDSHSNWCAQTRSRGFPAAAAAAAQYSRRHQGGIHAAGCRRAYLLPASPGGGILIGGPGRAQFRRR